MGIATATVKGGFFAQYASTIASMQGSGFARRQIAKLFGTKGMMDERALALALNGVAAGAAAAKALGRIEANSELGGKRTVESEAIINRNTAAADITALAADIYAYSGKTTLASPANLDGNPLGTR